MSLPAHIRKNLDAVVRDWQEFAVSLLPESSQLSSLALRDHAEQILYAIAADVETVQSTQESIQKSRGRRPQLSRVTETAAEIHGALRQKAGFNISQLAAEYRALRSSVLRSWRAVRVSLPTDEMMATRFHEAIDECLAESVARYSVEVERGHNLFIGMIGHDIRTPLAAISMSAAALRLGGLEGAASAGAASAASLNRIERSAKTIDAMVTDLLNFAHIGAGTDLPLHRDRVDMNLVCGTAIDDVSAAHPEAKIAYETHGTSLGTWDAHRMGQVLRNLLANAIAYGHRQTLIVVRMTQDDRAVLLVVENSGPTIPPAWLKRIFDPFARVALVVDDDSAQGEHLGLGLYIVREIVSAHGGAVWATSQLGITRFNVLLPNDRLDVPSSLAEGDLKNRTFAAELLVSL